MSTPVSLLQQMTLEHPTEFWNDSCELGSLRRAIAQGATGATTNPVIVLEAIESDRALWSDRVRKLIRKNPGHSEEQLAWLLVSLAAREGAALLEPVFQARGGKAGRLSIQVNPRYHPSTELMVRHATELFALAPNMAIKVPAVAAGVGAIEELTARGVVINATVLFTLPQALAVAEAVERGLARAERAGIDIARVTPWITIMVGRLDDHLRDVAKQQQLTVDPEHVRQASTAVMRKAYRIFQERGYRSTLLAAAMRSHHHWSEFIGGKLVVTIPPAWQEKFNASGVEVKARIFDPVDEKIIEELLATFPDFGRAYREDGMRPEEFVSFGSTVKTLHQFLDGYDRLLRFVREVMLPR